MTSGDRVLGVVVSGLLMLSFTACAGGGYCQLVTDYHDDFVPFYGPEVTGADELKEFAGQLEEIAAAAPDDVALDWEELAASHLDLAEGNLIGDEIPDNTRLTDSVSYASAVESVRTSVEEECGITLD